MSAGAILSHDRFSFVTIAGPGDAIPAWTRLLRWPSIGDQHIDLPLRADSDRSVWAARLDDVVNHAEHAVVLIAEGVHCSAASWWARLSPAHYVERVAGALFFDPDDVRDVDPQRSPFLAPPIALPFPSIVVADSGVTNNDRGAISALTAQWGSRVVDASRPRKQDQTAWRAAQRLIERATFAVVAHDIRRARKLVAINNR